MYYRTKENTKGKVRYEVVEKYKDPLTDKWKTAVVSYEKNTSRARKQAERELMDKIDNLIGQTEYRFNPQKIKTFGELKQSWLENWAVSVKPQTVKREKLVIKRLGQIIGDDYLLKKITPMLMKKSLSTYMEKYDASPSTMTHIKSTCNKIFNHGVLYNVIDYSPMSVVKIDIPLEKKREAKKRREAKFLEIHELHAFFDTLSRRRNPNYYDLAIVLLFSGLRIGEAAFTEEDFDSDTGVLTIDKALQYHDLRVADFHFGETKTLNADREVALPRVACEAILRVIERSREFNQYMIENPNVNFTKSESIFRTEYGSPITSHSFREVLARVEKELICNCEQKYGFKWIKHVTPHSFRHMHISYLQSEEMTIAISDVMARVGHANYETTMGYTHRVKQSQEQTVQALDKFAEAHQFQFARLQKWSCQYSAKINELIEQHKTVGSVELTLDEFREYLDFSPTYQPRHISGNIIPKITKDMSKHYRNFQVISNREGSQRILGYTLTW
ncbi:tyrosine-type recombinase/integrase [Streptococcus fryi]